MDILISAVPFILIFFGILAVAFIVMKIIERNQIKKRLAKKQVFPVAIMQITDVVAQLEDIKIILVYLVCAVSMIFGVTLFRQFRK